MERIKKAMVKVSMVTAGVLAPVAAFAEPTFTITPPELDYVSLGTYATAILGGLAAIWLIRKFIKVTNRS